MSGGDRVVACLTDMYGEYQLFLEAEEEDNKKDDDKDGIADVDQLVSAPWTHPAPAAVRASGRAERARASRS